MSLASASPKTGFRPAPLTRRGETTRARLQEATVRALNKYGYADLGIREIAAEAKVPVSLFYHYFADKQDLTAKAISQTIHELFDGMREALKAELEKPATSADCAAFRAIHAPAVKLAQDYSRAPGVMRCMLQFGEAEARFTAAYQAERKEWYQGIARWIERVAPSAKLSAPTRLALAYACSGMIDRLLFLAYASPLTEVREGFENPADIARFLSIGWFRLLFKAMPPEAHLGRHAALGAMDARAAGEGR